MERLKSRALEACRCARRMEAGSQREACWAQFEAHVDRYEHSDVDTYCHPISPSSVCFGGGPENCIVREYGSGACTLDEARTLEAIWSRHSGPDQPSQERAGMLMNEAVQGFIRGDPVPPSRSSGGCAL